MHQFLTQNAALQGQRVVLVGHSYGGAVITNAAVDAPGVRALVYVDAFIPDQGDTIGALASAEPGCCLGNEAFAATQRPLTASAFIGPSGPPAWKTIPSWAVIGTGDRVIPAAELTFMAKRADARITDVDAGHLSLISEAPLVTRVISRPSRPPDDS